VAFPAPALPMVRETPRVNGVGGCVVPSEEGPHRKYYGLNETGRIKFSTSTETWGAFARTMNDLLDERGS
jgi:PadR family transcriptional regulator, regulatory protein PadR